MIRNEIHTRADFARNKFNEYAKLLSDKVNGNGSIQGNNPQKWLRKMNQANRIWNYYVGVFGRELLK